MFVQSLIDPCGIKTDILLIYIGMRNRTLYNYTINKMIKLLELIYLSINCMTFKIEAFQFLKRHICK